MLGLLSLVCSNIMNAIGLIGLRQYAHEYFLFLRVIFWAYAFCGFIPFLLTSTWRQLNIRWLWFLPWACALVVIYFLYSRFPGTVSFSQLVVIQSMSPFLALFIRVCLGFEKVAKSEWKNALPLLLLLFIAILQWNPSGNIYVLIGLAVAYLTTQISGRNFANMPRTQALLILNTATFFLLSAWLMVEKVPVLVGGIPFCGVIAGFSVLLFSVQALFLYGIKNTPPVLSALGISSTVPIGILMESIVKKTVPSTLVLVCLIVYVCSVAWIALTRKAA
jgi:drug/metabolite transporter (DMT)-like permease